MNRHSRNAGWGIALIVAGVVLLLENFDILPLGKILWTLAALVLIWWGYTFIRRSRRHRHEEGSFALFDDRVTHTAAARINHSSIFGDCRIKVDSKEFSGGSCQTVFGTMTINLSEVQSISGSGHLDLHSVFGDILIRLPARTACKVAGGSLFGSLIAPDGTRLHGKEYTSDDFDTAAKRLNVHVSQVFGDVELMS